MQAVSLIEETEDWLIPAYEALRRMFGLEQTGVIEGTQETISLGNASAGQLVGSGALQGEEFLHDTTGVALGRVKVLVIKGLLYRQAKAIEISDYLIEVCRQMDTTRRFTTADQARVRSAALKVGDHPRRHWPDCVARLTLMWCRTMRSLWSWERPVRQCLLCVKGRSG